MVTRPAWVHLASLHSKSLEGTSKANLLVHAGDRIIDPLGRSLGKHSSGPLVAGPCVPSEVVAPGVLNLGRSGKPGCDCLAPSLSTYRSPKTCAHVQTYMQSFSESDMFSAHAPRTLVLHPDICASPANSDI